MKRPKLAKLELRILEALWTHGRASMREIQEAFPEPRPAYTTITNTVYRMEAKKVGFYREQFFKQWPGIADFVKPSEAVGRLGLKPEDITDLVITHMHWDHADGMDLFPKARIWLQKDELEYYAGAAWQSRNTH